MAKMSAYLAAWVLTARSPQVIYQKYTEYSSKNQFSTVHLVLIFSNRVNLYALNISFISWLTHSVLISNISKYAIICVSLNIASHLKMLFFLSFFLLILLSLKTKNRNLFFHMECTSKDEHRMVWLKHCSNNKTRKKISSQV